MVIRAYSSPSHSAIGVQSSLATERLFWAPPPAQSCMHAPLGTGKKRNKKKKVQTRQENMVGRGS